MIPQILPFDQVGRRNDVELSAFARGPQERPLTVFVDVDGCGNDTVIQTLRGFGANHHVRVEDIHLDQIQLDDDGCATLDREHDDATSRHFFRSARHNLNTLPSWGVSLDRAQDPKIEDRLILAMLAGRIGCDALVTESSQLLSLGPRFYGRSNVMRPTDALGAIGLHLRLREEFVYKQLPGYRKTTDGTSFYDMLAHDLLPEGWRWYAACPTGTNALQPSANGLASAIHARITRAVRARDRMLGYLFRVPSNSAIDEALFYFDGFLVALAGAFDAAARVAGKLHKIDTKGASWRSQPWLDKLAKSAHPLAALSARGTEVRDIIDLVFVLRNLVHGEPLRIVGELEPSGDVAQYKAAVSSQERQALDAALKRRGGPATWGIAELGDGAVSLDLRMYAERLLPQACRQLNVLMKATNVERFGQLRRGTPCGPPGEVSQCLAQFRLLGGIGD